jgi:hypothetical protein
MRIARYGVRMGSTEATIRGHIRTPAQPPIKTHGGAPRPDAFAIGVTQGQSVSGIDITLLPE